MGKPTDEIRARLDELGVEYTSAEDAGGTQHVWWSDGEKEVCAIDSGRMSDELAVYHLTPEQAIAATVGKRTDLSKRLRKITGLHAFAELFGFSWEDGSDWTWHDVACAMADAVDAAMAGNARKPSEAVIERIERFCTDYAHCLMDSTILVKRNYESMDLRAVKKAEVVEDRLIRELAEYIATVGKDIEHYDGSGRRGTVAILQGGREPEEVLFVRDVGGVTHYLPEGAGTCKRIYHPNRITKKCTCSNCGYGASDERWAYCPKCGHKYVYGEVEEMMKAAGRKVAE